MIIGLPLWCIERNRNGVMYQRILAGNLISSAKKTGEKMDISTKQQPQTYCQRKGHGQAIS